MLHLGAGVSGQLLISSLFMPWGKMCQNTLDWGLVCPQIQYCFGQEKDLLLVLEI